MTYEFTMRDGTKFTINKETMTGVLNGETRRVNFWPLEDSDPEFTYSFVPDIISWREIPDVSSNVPDVPVLPSPSTSDFRDGDVEISQRESSMVQVPSIPQIPDSDTSWIK